MYLNCDIPEGMYNQGSIVPISEYFKLLHLDILKGGASILFAECKCLGKDRR